MSKPYKEELSNYSTCPVCKSRYNHDDTEIKGYCSEECYHLDAICPECLETEMSFSKKSGLYYCDNCMNNYYDFEVEFENQI